MVKFKKYLACLITSFFIFGCKNKPCKIREVYSDYNKEHSSLFARYFVVNCDVNNSIQAGQKIDSVYNLVLKDSSFHNKINTIPTVELWFVKEDKYIEGLDTINSITDNTFLEHKEIVRKVVWFKGELVK